MKADDTFHFGCRASIRARVDRFGFAFMPGWSEGITTLDAASSLGEPMAPANGAAVQRLVPLATSTPNTYSGNYGLGVFPFHTDLAQWPVPPRFLLLRCVQGYADVPTLLLDGLAIVARIGTDAARRAVLRSRRPQAGEIRLLRLLQDGSDGTMLRWDGIYLKPASRIGDEVFAAMRDGIAEATPQCVAMVDDGDTLIIDNWRMLHARSAVPDDRRDRHLERVYLRSLH